MQFGHALNRLLQEILLANPSHILVEMMKVDLSIDFYHINLNVDNNLKLGVTFPTRPEEEPHVAFPLYFPWTGRTC